MPNLLLSPQAGSATLRLTLVNLYAVLVGHPAMTPIPPPAG